MALKLHLAGRIEDFLRPLSAQLNSGDPLKKPPRLVIQNRNMGEWLKLQMAQIRGICAGLDILFPEQAVRHYMQGFSHPYEEKTILYMDNLKVVLYKKLNELLDSDNEVYKPLVGYLLTQGQDSTSREERLYQMADVLGGLFYHYGMNCLEMTAHWDRGELHPQGSAMEQEHQLWQMQLWQELFHEGSPYVHLSRILLHIRSAQLPYQGSPEPLLLFGSSFLGEMGMGFFDYLSNYISVDFYYLIPSKIFDPQAENPQGLQDFWASWGQLAQGLSSVLGSLNPTSGSFFPPESFEKSLLGSLQQGLWENRALEEIKIEPDDSSKSLQFFSASSERRQVEVLRDQLLSLLQQDPELQLSEICIMAPDISPFVGPLTTCLTQGEQPVIPCHFIDIRGRGKASFSQGFLKLLQLAGGRYSRWEIFSLFQNPCFAQAHNITPEVYQLWLKSCDDLHVFWAMDEDHRRSFHVGEGEVNTWDWAFKRLILGMITDDTHHPMVPWPESKESQFPQLGRLVHILRSLHNDLSRLSSSTMRLEQWVVQVEQLMEKYLQPRLQDEQDQLDRLALKACFRNMNQMVEDLQGWDESLSWTYFSMLLQELMGKTDRKRGNYLTQGVSCSSLKPLRGIPFKHIFLLGMDEGAFPYAERPWSFDLKSMTQSHIDLSRRSSDRFAFLETLMSARRGLHIFYKGRNPLSGEALLPSPVITELLQITSKGIEPLQLPLHGFDLSHFVKGSSLQSFSNEALNRALLILGPRKIFQGPQLLLKEESPPQVVTLNELRRFIKNPLAQFFQERLNIWFSQEELLEEQSNEAYEIPFLVQKDFLRRQMAVIAGEEPQDPLLWFMDQQRQGLISGSIWDNRQKEGLVEEAASLFKELEKKKAEFAGWESLEYLLLTSHSVERNYPGRAERPALVVQTSSGPIELSGEIHCYQKQRRYQTLDFVYGKNYRCKNALPVYLDYLVLAAINGDSSLKAHFVGSGGEYPSIYWGSQGDIPIAEPQETLQSLLELYISHRSQPMVLYPDLVDQLLTNKDDSWYRENRHEIPRNILNNWRSGSFNSPRDVERCEYARAFFPQGQTPGERELELIDLVYKPCIPSLNSKEDS